MDSALVFEAMIAWPGVTASSAAHRAGAHDGGLEYVHEPSGSLLTSPAGYSPVSSAASLAKRWQVLTSESLSARRMKRKSVIADSTPCLVSVYSSSSPKTVRPS